MRQLKQILIFVSVYLSLNLTSYSQNYSYPVNIAPALSGGFGELRSNHFHSGIDFKTEQVINKPILSIADGYISRISVSPGGYGLALYITHPSTGHTSVYAHLSSFSQEIADWVKIKQYELEKFNVTLYPDKRALPVKRGQQIALSGNTGSSGGPHLHFEIRDTRSEDPLDPLEFLSPISDTQKPDLRGISFYPIKSMGVINNDINPIRFNISKYGNGIPLGLEKAINAWGRIGFGVKAYDRMNGQNNIYGVKYIRLYVDEIQIFSSTIKRYSFDKTRMLNSLIDFEDWKTSGSFYMRSFVEPGNTLPFYNSINNGFIDINEEREYNLRYELEDHYGNTIKYNFKVNGVKQSIPESDKCDSFMIWNMNNSFIDMGFTLSVPAGNLYSNVYFNYNKSENSKYFSDVHQINDYPVPLHNSADVWIRLTTDTLENRKNYGVVRINYNGYESWLGGEYNQGGISFNISELGQKYAVAADKAAPAITPINPENWVSEKRIRIRLTDNFSGVTSFRGEINGKFVLFTHDSKSSIFSYVFDDERLTKGEKQTLIFKATDGAGNSNSYRYTFNY